MSPGVRCLWLDASHPDFIDMATMVVEDASGESDVRD